MKAAPVAVVLAALTLGCGADAGDVRAQWLVTVATDAPIPRFGDRLLIELLDDDGSVACTGCRRVLGAPLETWPVSFGIVPSSSASHLRVRLYRVSLPADLEGLPSSGALIDFLGSLPKAHEKTEVGVFLRTECFGQPADLAAGTTCLPETGSVGAEPVLGPLERDAKPGSSKLAQPDPCTSEGSEGTACVQGGLLVLGSPEVGLPLMSPPSPEHLVRLSPFALDTDEMTVGIVRSLILSGQVSAQPKTKGTNPDRADFACTFLGPSDASHDAWPVNCVTKALAMEVCSALGKRLPTEAEWEWAAGNLEHETRYPWGDSEEVCDHAIVGRGRESSVEVDIDDPDAQDETTSCRTSGESGVLPWGPTPGGSDDDATELGLRNLAGNMAEFVLDDFEEYSGPCWNSGPVLYDPACEGLRLSSSVVRGGSWGGMEAWARGALRNETSPSGNQLTGFRCAGPIR